LPVKNENRARKKIEEKKKCTSVTSGATVAGRKDLFLAKRELDQLHKKARELLEQGKYREAFEAYVEYGDSMGKVRGLAGVEAAIVEGARRFEGLMFWYEAGNLYLIAANYLNNQGVFPDAGEFYLRTAEALEKSKEKDIGGVITGCYAEAAHALREAKATAESEKAVMKGVFVATGEKPLEVEGNALKVLRTGDLRSASDMFERAASVYQRAIQALSNIVPAIKSGSQAIDVKSILHHRAAQNFLASAAALSKSNDKLRSIKEGLGRAADEYMSAVINFTPLFTVGEPHKEDYRRYSYDIMMAAALRILLDSTEDMKTLKEQLSNIGPKHTKQLREGKYLDIALTLMRTEKIKSVINDLQEVRFGNIEEVKDDIIELLNKR
jgi:tetratricopeptide (TPR) repeat protein